METLYQNNLIVAEYLGLRAHVHAVDQDELIHSDVIETRYRARLLWEANNCRRIARETPEDHVLRKCMLDYAAELETEYAEAVARC